MNYKIMKKSVVIFFLGCALFIINSELKAQAPEHLKAVKSENVTRLQLTVEGMSCQAGCADGIDNMLKQQTGIAKSKTTFDTPTSEIWYNEELISGKEIIELIKDRGFKVEVEVEEKDLSKKN